MAKCRSLRDDVCAVVAALPPQNGGWFKRLTDEQQKELLGIRSDWKAGKILASGRGLAKSLHQVCRERGIVVASVERVREWLAKD